MNTRRFLLSLVLLFTLPGYAQVLARPGWAGSGVTPESWWHRAIFYRIDPARFQDSNADGTGDLDGIAQRLDYLQSVGVDALVLDGSFDPNGLEDLVREASRHHLRLLLTVRTGSPRQPRDKVLQAVHDALGAGAAGVWVPKAGSLSSPGSEAAYAALVSSVRAVLHSFPGDRVLIADPLPATALEESMPSPQRRSTRRNSLAPAPAHSSQLTAAPAIPITAPDLTAILSTLSAATQSTAPETNPLLQLGEDPATAAPNAAADAALLLASRGAALFDFGDEIGLDLFPATTAHTAEPPPLMQWTPSNHTPAPVERTEKPETSAPGSATQFGAYHPYQPPPRDLRGPSFPAPHVVPDANIPVALPDPDSLPGFTAGTLPVPPVNGAKLNVTTEDRDPKSLLNAYRQLIGLHHDNATLRNGSQYLINRDAQDALVWIRRAPAGARTVANVLVAANLSAKPITLVLDADIENLGMRSGELRPLFTWSSTPLTGETTTHLSLPPHAVFVGEIYHAGALGYGPAPRRSRRRIRR